MPVPNTPEALFEHLSNSSVRDMFANYDQLKPRHRKLIDVLHTELTKGELSDAAFMDCICFITVLWRCFNNTACIQINRLIDDNSEIDPAWIHQALEIAKVAQFVHTLLNAYDAAPDLTELADESTYHLDTNS